MTNDFTAALQPERVFYVGHFYERFYQEPRPVRRETLYDTLPEGE